MHTYTEKKFNIPELNGLSAKQIEIHLNLYAGYVKHVNLLRENIHILEDEDKEKHSYTIAELRRRFSFEFNGMRMHEHYFECFEGGPKTPDESSALVQAVSEKYGDWEKFILHFTAVGMSRGIGWTVLYYDPDSDKPLQAAAAVPKAERITIGVDPIGKTPNSPSGVGEPHVAWVGDHELGTLAGLPILLPLDMWEHAYMVDYTPAEKNKYIEAFLSNLNWGVIEKRLSA